MYDNYLRFITNLNYVIYARLSKEEQGKSKEEQSRSIKNQINVCQNYLEEEKRTYPNCHYKEIAILKDDGISGTTFNRENFNKLITLIEQKQVNMVLTKDLSRLGRDHIQTDDYLEKWFPEHNVRFISIMENIDTFADSLSNEIAPIINWSNENFARQTSKKIKKTFFQYRLEGKWTGGEIPLGYKKDPLNKYHFIIDKKGKEIVERIFKLALNKYSPEKISNILNKECVPLPTRIKRNKRKLNNNSWSAHTIKSILQNQMYLGYMVQGKTTRLNHKSSKIIYLPQDKWIIVPNKHEAIIDINTFNNVNLLLNTNKNKTINSPDYLLKGLLKCSKCKNNISLQTYKKRKIRYTICNKYRKYGHKENGCTAHRFNYDKIENIVINNLKEECLYSFDQNKLKEIMQNKEKDKTRIKQIKDNIQKEKKELFKIKEQIKEIYNDKLEGIIDKEIYQSIKKSKDNDLSYIKIKITRYKKELKEIMMKNNNIDYEKVIYDYLNKPSKLLILNLIEKIYINEDGIIDIYYKGKK